MGRVNLKSGGRSVPLGPCRISESPRKACSAAENPEQGLGQLLACGRLWEGRTRLQTRPLSRRLAMRPAEIARFPCGFYLLRGGGHRDTTEQRVAGKDQSRINAWIWAIPGSARSQFQAAHVAGNARTLTRPRGWGGGQRARWQTRRGKPQPRAGISPWLSAAGTQRVKAEE